jgi:hypothetical protein
MTAVAPVSPPTKPMLALTGMPRRVAAKVNDMVARLPAK